MKLPLLIVALLCSLFGGASFAEEISPAAGGRSKTVRLLTIGNSFSANATHFLGDLAKAGGHALIHRPLVIGGSSFQVHLEKAEKHEAAPQDKAGLYTSGRGLKENLGGEAWDYVTIQQASRKSHDFSTYEPYASRLRDYIARHAPRAKLLIHQTWAYRKDDPRFTRPSSQSGEPATQEAMYRGLTAAYDKLASALGARVIPVGDAFFTADTDARWGYQTDTTFHPKTAAVPELPKQTHSLHKGWEWRKQKDGKSIWNMDGHHANTAGEYLAACVWYEVLFGESAMGTAFTPPGLEPDYARFLRETAHRAVQARTK